MATWKVALTFDPSEELKKKLPDRDPWLGEVTVDAETMVEAVGAAMDQARDFWCCIPKSIAGQVWEEAFSKGPLTLEVTRCG